MISACALHDASERQRDRTAGTCWPFVLCSSSLNTLRTDMLVSSNLLRTSTQAAAQWIVTWRAELACIFPQNEVISSNVPSYTQGRVDTYSSDYVLCTMQCICVYFLCFVVCRTKVGHSRVAMVVYMNYWWKLTAKEMWFSGAKGFTRLNRINLIMKYILCVHALHRRPTYVFLHLTQVFPFKVSCCLWTPREQSNSFVHEEAKGKSSP